MPSSTLHLGLASLVLAMSGVGCGSSSADSHPSSSAGAAGSAGDKASGGDKASAGEQANGGVPSSAGSSSAGDGTSASGGGNGSVNPSGGWTAADIPAVGTPGVDYVSDLTWKTAVVFSDFGQPGADSPIGKDKTVNGRTPLVINGVSYAKGLGVKTYTEITYDLGGKYKQFVSDTGLDFQEDASTMIFELKLDGELVYDGGDKAYNKSQLEHVTIDVTGKSSLMLYVRDGFDEKTHDFGIWGGARLIK